MRISYKVKKSITACFAEEAWQKMIEIEIETETVTETEYTNGVETRLGHQHDAKEVVGNEIVNLCLPPAVDCAPEDVVTATSSRIQIVIVIENRC